MSLSGPSLPISAQLPDALEALAAHGALVLSAPPGSGKTTRLPLAIDEWLQAKPVRAERWGGERVLVLQPRRLAARAVAEYMASLSGRPLGELVGYRVRFESAVSELTRVEVITEGLLTRRALSDPELSGVGCVILDEFHERSLHADLALSLLLELREAYRPELRLVLMSATLGDEATRLAARLQCPLIQAAGRTFPVEVCYEQRPYQGDPCERAPSVIATRWRALHGEGSKPQAQGGSLLAFFPGKREIERARQALAHLDPSIPVVVLYGGLKPHEQRAALDPNAPPRVVLSTNVAETSVTIEGVSEVIDTGLARQTEYDPRRGLERLTLTPIAHDAAEQRAGRAGRTHAGRCFRLWSAHQDAQRPAQSAPELTRADLSSTLLQVAAWAGDWRGFVWYERPPALHLTRAAERLQLLGALDDRGRLTSLGEALSLVSLPPWLALSLAFAQRCGCEEEVALISALSAQDRDLLALEPHQPRGVDVWLRVEAMNDLERGRVWPELRRGVAAQVQRACQQVLKQAQALQAIHPALTPRLEAALARDGRALSELSPYERVGLALCLGNPHRLTARRSSDERRALMSEGGEVLIEPHAFEGRDGPFVTLSLHQTERAAPRVTLACPVDQAWLVGELRRTLRFDEERAGVYLSLRESLGDLCLSERLSPAPFNEESALILCEALSAEPWRWCQLSGAERRWLERARWLSARLGDAASLEIEPWWGLLPEDEGRFERGSAPPLSERVVALLEALCSPHVALKSPSFKGLKGAELMPIMMGLTPSPERQLIERLAPEHYLLPTGQQTSIHYELGAPPQVSAYLQAFFGVDAHPSLGEGAEAIPLQLSLLAPNKRPAQITSDLPSFWRGAYADVRKQLRARYAKHHWPEDPLSMGPQRGAKRRGPAAKG